MMRRTSAPVAVAVLVAVVLAIALPACSRPVGGPVVTAEFARGTGLYPGSPVRLLGLDIGRVTDVDNEEGLVVVRMQLDAGTRLPADVGATIIPLTLLGERYVQFGPTWRSGPVLGDGDRIPLSRTRVPAEIDDLLRSLQDFMGAVDPDRAGDVVTNLASILDGRGADINLLIENASGTLGLLADEGEDLAAIITSLRELSSTLKGRTDSIESLIRNYELVSQVLIDNREDLDGVITELDRATVELAGLLAAHGDPLREDVRILADTTAIVGANAENLELTLRSTVRLFEAAGRAYESRTNALRVNNQLSPELTSDLIAGRLRDRIAGLCRRLGIVACSDPASPLLNEVAALLPGLLDRIGEETGGLPPGPPAAPALPQPPALTAGAPPTGPTDDELLAALIDQLIDGIDDAQAELLEVLDGEALAALLGVDPALLQILGELDEDQIRRIQDADPRDLPQLMLDLFNEVNPPAGRLDEPLLPPRPPVTLPPLRPGDGPVVTLPDLSNPLGG